MSVSSDDPVHLVPNDLLDASKPDEFAFFQWLCKRGFDASELVLGVTSFEATGRGTVALRPIKTGDLLLKIPEESILSRPNGLKWSPLRPVLEDTPIGQDGFTGLIVLLMFEQTNPTSHWAEFFKVLPTTFETPIFWRRSSLALLRSTLLFQETIKLKNMLCTFYRTVIQTLTQQYESLIGEKFTFQRFLWAISTVWNRAYWLDDNDTIPGIVPLADMMNHTHRRGVGLYSASGVADYRFYSDKLSFQVTSYANYRSGEEVFTSYGTKDNTALLSDYGFLISQLSGAAATVHLSLETLPDYYPHIFNDEYPERETQATPNSLVDSPEDSDTSRIAGSQKIASVSPRPLIDYVNEILGWLKIAPLDRNQWRNSKLIVCCQGFPWQLVALCRICNLPGDVLAVVTKENAQELKEESSFDFEIEKASLVAAVAICQSQALLGSSENDDGIDNTEDFAPDLSDGRHKLHCKFGEQYLDLQRNGLISIIQSLQSCVESLALEEDSKSSSKKTLSS